MDFIERWDRAIEGGLQLLVQKSLGGAGAVEFLEAYSGALEEIASQVQSLGGKRVFPFKRVMMVFALDDGARVPAISQMLSQRALLVDEVRRRLDEAGCERPVPLRVEGQALPARDGQLGGKPYRVSFSTELPPQPSLTVKVAKGHSERRTYVLSQTTVNIGRTPEVQDERRRVIRRNQIVFSERDPDVGATVSRIHAHIMFEPDVGWFRLYDDNSKYGTRICRGDLLIDVPAGPQRGAWLRSGDEIHLGQARLLATFTDD